MFQDLKGFAQFISVERGLMILMISVGASFLMSGSLVWFEAVFLGVIAFCIWSAADAMNNIFDVDLDMLSDPFRAEFTKKLGKFGLLIAMFFTALSLLLGAFTMTPCVVLFIIIGIMFGVLYSVPPFRLRKTAYKPILNFSVGAVPILIIAAFFNAFTPNIIALILLIGVTTAVNSLWEDLADYASDFSSGSRTIPIILGFKRGLIFTIIMGYTLIPLMILVGILFQLSWVYYVTLTALSVFVSLRVYQKRHTLLREGKEDTKQLFKIGEVLAQDFVLIAIVFTLSLMLSSLLKIATSPF
jgi:4-hydroxybenzoate polyprenyltransferase